ncbi:PREDICTED: cytochrome c oxidase assembly factor 6 homolog [Galeopterus variegatus]|uniref:Cytochrome c oxidase assembly factor 6 homolog n=1 Tax=Galeopterus variegatus TaxID=482537 RepID=A0ABM0RKA2_GALVR|nr:PREDICTED: cytochrome c oxidase assembly factor 6 homolog [Galeopterus variegatus]
MAAPSMRERQACWGARDEYWKCLDENTEDAARCKKLRSSFESSCPQQWVSRALRGFCSLSGARGVSGRLGSQRRPRHVHPRFL